MKNKLTPDTEDKLKRAHETLRSLFLGQETPYEHASEVETAFFDWLETDNGHTSYCDLNQDQIRGFDSMSEETAEKALSFVEDKHPQVLED